MFPWIRKIPISQSHGSGKYQKKLWKVTSDFVRIRDWYEYNGECISCGRIMPSWSDKTWQACHYKSFGSCRGYSKFDVKNIFGGCSYDNTGWNANDTASIFKENIIKRYGQKRLDYIDMLAKYPTEKMDDYKCVLLIKEILKDMASLPEQPDYWHDVINML